MGNMIYNSVEKFFDAVQELIKGKVTTTKDIAGNGKVAPEQAEQYNKDLMSQQNQAQPNGPRNIQRDIQLLVGKHFQSTPDERGVKRAADEILAKYGKHPTVNNDAKIRNLNQGVNDSPNQMAELGSSEMERKIMNFKDFVNEGIFWKNFENIIKNFEEDDLIYIKMSKEMIENIDDEEEGEWMVGKEYEGQINYIDEHEIILYLQDKSGYGGYLYIHPGDKGDVTIKKRKNK